MSGTLSFQGFDFHCHIDLHRDPAALIGACERDQILTLAVTTTPKAWPQNRRWTAKSAYIHAAVGLHPELVGERYSEVELLEKYIGECGFIGEIGLDGSPRYRKTRAAQRDVFERALKRAQTLGSRVLSIHSRRAADDVVELLAQHTTPERVLPILHWYSGSAACALRAIERGCYFSINRRMLEHKAGTALVRRLPLGRLLTETDAPFTTQGNQPAIASETRSTTNALAQILAMDSSELLEILCQNAEHVLRHGGLGNVAQ